MQRSSVNDWPSDKDEQGYCIGRVYYGPYPWNFVWCDISCVDDKHFAPTPQIWTELNPDVSPERLKELADLEWPF